MRSAPETDAILQRVEHITKTPIEFSPDLQSPYLLAQMTMARAAVRLMPKDQATLQGLAHCLELSGGVEKVVEADSFYYQVLALDSNSDIVELAKQAQRRIAQQTVRNGAGSPVRMDAVMYCRDAITRIAKMDRKRVQDITFETGMLGQNGLDINNPAHKYRLRNLKGEFSGLQLVSIMYVGCKQLT